MYEPQTWSRSFTLCEYVFTVEWRTTNDEIPICIDKASNPKLE